MITGAQIRAARAFLQWSRVELAAKAEVAPSTIQVIEAIDGSAAVSGPKWRATAREEAIKALRAALMRAGVTFLNDDGNGLGVRVTEYAAPEEDALKLTDRWVLGPNWRPLYRPHFNL